MIRKRFGGLLTAALLLLGAATTGAQAQDKTPVKTSYSVSLASIIAAFRDAETESRLLLTSRYTFALTDRRSDDRYALPRAGASRGEAGRRASGQSRGSRGFQLVFEHLHLLLLLLQLAALFL